jgi:hypothetical protein
MTIRSASRSTSYSLVLRAPGSSPTIPARMGTPPASVTSPASAEAVASRTCPGASSIVRGGTTSSPVEMIATRGRACTAMVVTPAAARSPRSGARSGRPAGTSSAPAATSSSARTSPPPGATGRVISIVPGMVSAVYSTMTTASAPSGSTAPVGIATQPPGRTATLGAAPIRTAPTRSRYEGRLSEAP